MADKNSLGRKTLLIVANNFLGGAMGWFILYLIFQNMENPAHDYGIVSFALGFLGMFMIILTPGTNTVHIKRISEGRDIGKCVGTYLAIKSVLTPLYLVVVISVLFGWEFLLGYGFESPQHKYVIYLLLLNFVLGSYISVFISTFQGKKEIAKVQLCMLLSTIAKLATVLVIVGLNMGPMALAMAWNMSNIAYIISCAVLFFKDYKVKRPTWAMSKDYIKFSLPLLFFTLAGMLAVTTDRVMIQLFWSSEDVGIYFAAYQITVFITTFGVAVRTLVLPTISKFHKEKNYKQIQFLTKMAEKYISLFILPICMFVVFFPEGVVKIMLGPKAMDSAPILAIFGIFVMFQVLSIPYGPQLSGTNRPKLTAALGIPRFGLNILFNLIFIAPSVMGITLLGWGAKGAAIGTLLSTVIYYIALRIVVYKFISGSKGSWRIVLNALGAFIMAVVMKYALAPYWAIDRFYDLIGYSIVGAVIYFALMFIFREFGKNEVKYIWGIINPREMTRYIKKELR